MKQEKLKWLLRVRKRWVFFFFHTAEDFSFPCPSHYFKRRGLLLQEAKNRSQTTWVGWITKEPGCPLLHLTHPGFLENVDFTWNLELHLGLRIQTQHPLPVVLQIELFLKPEGKRPGHCELLLTIKRLYTAGCKFPQGISLIKQKCNSILLVLVYDLYIWWYCDDILFV